MEVLFDIYNDAYSIAMQNGATEDEARKYAESYRENIKDYLSDYYV